MTALVPNQPYNLLPALPPSVELETKAVLKLCIEARTALAELKQVGRTIPDVAVLINTIPLLEAQASSEIENIVTTRDRLFRYAQTLDEKADPATKEAHRYRTALQRGFQELEERPLNTNTAIEVCRRVLRQDISLRRVPGVKLVNDRTGKVIYAPPEGEPLLRELLANWEWFLHERTDLDPLVRMAVGHYQFEAIHPFADGNGRTGRIINLLFLIEQGLLELPVLYLSRHALHHRADYYSLLLAVTAEHAWEAWLLFVLEGVRETAEWTSRKIIGIRDLIEATVRDLQVELPKVYSRELVEVLFTQPYCRISDLVDAGIAKRQTASSYLRQLRDAGFVNEVKVGRDKLFLNPRYLELLLTDSETDGHEQDGV